MIVTADIGGTKVDVGQVIDGNISGRRHTYASADFNNLASLLTEFLQGSKLDGLAIGAAGPVVNRRAKVTNLPWTVDADEISSAFHCPCHLVNDLVAHAYGILNLSESFLVNLQPGEPIAGNRGLIAAGTGLGECLLFWDGDRYHPSASEGSHASFGPITDEDVEIWRFLHQKHHHISWERVVSGNDGFRSLLDFYARDCKESGADLIAATEGRQAVGEIVTRYADSGDELAQTVLRTFVRLYGAEAGNLALKGLTVGGLYLGGGVTGKIIPWLKKPEFIEAFCAKGRFRNLLSNMPVNIIVDPDLALRGLATLVH